MGATEDRSPGRHRGSPKRRRHDSGSPSRKHRRHEAEYHQEHSRHDRERSRERSREHRTEQGRNDRVVDRQDRSRGYDDKQQQYHSRQRSTEADYQQQVGTDRRGTHDRDRHRDRDRPDYPNRNQHGRGDDHDSRRDHDKPRDERERRQQQQHAQPREMQQQERSRGPAEGRGLTSGKQQQQQRPPDRGPWRREDDGGGKQRWGKPEEWAADEAAAAAPAAPKEQPNLGLSGKLAAESNKTVDGTAQLKYQPPPEARVCKKPPWRLYVFKGAEEAAPPITLNQTPYYLFGKDRKVADIPTDHPSCSRQHAVLCFREVEIDAPDGIAVMRVVKPYIIDLESINGTHLNGEKIEAARYYELLHQDVIKFGLSSREYVMMNEAAVK